LTSFDSHFSGVNTVCQTDRHSDAQFGQNHADVLAWRFGVWDGGCKIRFYY